MKHPVYFSRPAVLCAAGNNSKELWDSCVSGNQSGIKKVTALNGKNFFAAKIDDSILRPSTARLDMRIIRIEEKCLEQIEDYIEIAKERFLPERIGVCVGSCDNGTEFSVGGHRVFFEKGAFPENYTLEHQSADYVATFIAEKYGLTGPIVTFSTACSSSAGAIIKAEQLLQADICDAVIAGGVDIVSDTVLMGFDSLEAVSPEITNPFSKNRHGITLGDGAAFFVMTRNPIKSSPVQVMLLGYGESADAYHVTTPAPDGSGAFSAMKEALKNANLDAQKIDYLNLHGTGTKFNDSMEAKAVNEVFADYKIPCSTTKPLTGHTLGAAGALECAICYETIVNNRKSDKIVLPIQMWDNEKDENLADLNFIGKETGTVGKKVEICMSNSFAFGGANSSLILGTW